MHLHVIENKITTEYEAAVYVFGYPETDEGVRTNLIRALNTAIQTVRGAVGVDVDALMPYDPRVKELAHIYTDDLYTVRGVSAKVSGATRQLVATMELQLRMELRRLRGGAGA